jgi:hypothetical protein
MTAILARLTYFLADFKFYLIINLITITLVAAALLWVRKKLKSPSSQNWLIAFSTSLLAIVTLFTLAEVYFRYIYDASDGLGFLKVNQKWHQRHVVHNNYFRRDRNFEVEKRPSEYRIAVIGDSISFGGGVKHVDDRFSNLLEKKLRQDSLDVSVYNLAMSGINTDEEIRQFQGLRHLDFDLLVWQYFLNDASPTTDSAGSRILLENKESFTPVPLVKFITTRSFFADFIYWRLSSKYDQTFRQLAQADLNAYENPNIFQLHQAQIKQFLDQLKQENLPVVVIIFPFLYQTPYQELADKHYQQMIDLFENYGATAVIDLANALKPYPPQQLIASRFDSHPNTLVHRLAADLLYQKIKPLISPN